MIRNHPPYSLFCLAALVFVCGLSGCATPQDNAKTLLDRIEWEDDEQGCMELRATVDLSGNPFITTNGSLILKKSKGDMPPEC